MDTPERMTDPTRRPTEAAVAEWLGPRSRRRWESLRAYLATRYPGVFEVGWIFGGRKHGWALRYRKSRSFCTLVPERGRFRVGIVFGRAEREAAEACLAGLTTHVADDYRRAATYADGRWLLTEVDGAAARRDVERLLVVKRKPGGPARRAR